jgi:hypothetical protein
VRHLPADPRSHDEHAIGLEGQEGPQAERAHRHRDLGPLDNLVRIVGPGVGTLGLPTGAGLELDVDDTRGRHQCLAMSRVPCPPERAIGFLYGRSAEGG